MVCEKCKKREASIMFVEVINGNRKEHYYCTQCVADFDILQVMESEFPLTKLLSGVLGLDDAVPGEKQDEYVGIVCPTCHTSYRTFIEDSRFGCPDCYATFGPLLSASIHKLQDSDVHVGKRPKYHQNSEMDMSAPRKEADAAEQIALLQLKLQEALAEEDYEQAVVYRDAIRAIKEENHLDV